MKKILTLALVAILGVGISDAQLVKSRTYNTVEKKKNSYNRISVGYDAQFWSGDYIKAATDGEKSSLTGNGFNVAYIHGFGLSSSVPVFLETGIGLGFNSGSVKSKYDDDKATVSNLWVKVPVNVAYKANLTDNIALLPYTGINFRVNGTLSVNPDDDDSVSFFDDDMGGQRFQMGWQIGVGVNISKLYVGLQYGLDFMPLVKAPENDKYKINSSNLAVNIGYTW